MNAATAELHRHQSLDSAKLCVLAASNGRWPGRVTNLSAAGAFIQTIGRPPLGSQAALAHPEIGAIVAQVSGHGRDGVTLSFELSEESSAFVFAVSAHDMTVAPSA
ncbi:MAG: hypothetical protein WA979_02935 [Pacificimonas sp.]